MRWMILAIFMYVCLAIEQGLSVVLEQPGRYSFAPSLLLVLAVYVGMFAPTMMVCWTWLAVGLLYDVTHPIMLPGAMSDAAIIGPGALAYLLGAFAMLQLRGVVYRGSPLSIAIFSFVTGIFVHLALVLIFAMRSVSFLIFPGETIVGWSWSAELVGRFFSLLTTFAVAVPVGWLLLRMGSGVFGSDAPKGGNVRR